MTSSSTLTDKIVASVALANVAGAHIVCADIEAANLVAATCSMASRLSPNTLRCRQQLKGAAFAKQLRSRATASCCYCTQPPKTVQLADAVKGLAGFPYMEFGSLHGSNTMSTELNDAATRYGAAHLCCHCRRSRWGSPRSNPRDKPP